MCPLTKNVNETFRYMIKVVTKMASKLSILLIKQYVLLQIICQIIMKNIWNVYILFLVSLILWHLLFFVDLLSTFYSILLY